MFLPILKPKMTDEMTSKYSIKSKHIDELKNLHQANKLNKIGTEINEK